MNEDNNTMQGLMMAMYMEAALDEFDTLPSEAVRDIALYTAQRLEQNDVTGGTTGLTIPQLPGRTFDGYQFFAYFYAATATAFPEKTAMLNPQFELSLKAAQMRRRNKKSKS